MVEPKKKKEKTLSSLFSPKKNPLDLVAAIYPKGVPSIVPGTGERNKKKTWHQKNNKCWKLPLVVNIWKI